MKELEGLLLEQGVALLARQNTTNGYAERIGFIDATDANNLRFTSRDLNTFSFSNMGPQKNVVSLVSSGDSADGVVVTTREVVSSAEGLTTFKYTANHMRASLDIDWSVRIPGAAMRVFSSEGTTYLLTTDSTYSRSSGTYSYWYGNPRLHLLELIEGRAHLTDTLSLSGAVIGDVVGDATRLFVKTSPSYWSNTVDYQDTLKTIDLREGTLSLKSSTPMGSWGSSLMGVVGNQLFVSLSGDGVMIVDVADLESPKARHFMRTLGWATHVVFTATSAVIASGSFGLFEVPLSGAPSIPLQP